MNPVILYFASGESLYLGAALLMLVIIGSPLLTPPWSLRLRNISAWLGLAMMVMACPPFPFLVDLVFVAAFVLWFILSNRAGSKQSWLRLQRISAFALLLLLVILTASELPHRRMPVVTGTVDDHLVVIGDSISSGIDSRVPAWPLILQQISGVPVRNLSKPGAQVEDAIAMAEKLGVNDEVVLIEIGGNDLLMEVPSDEFRRRLDALLSKVTVPGRAGVMFELPLLPHKIAYGRVQRRLAAKYGILLIPKRYFADVIGGAGATSDGLHLSDSGVRRMATLVAHVLSPVLKPKSAPASF